MFRHRLNFDRLLEPVELEVEGLTKISGGFSSRVYRAEHQVLKVPRRSHATVSSAKRDSQRLRREQDSAIEHFGEKSAAIARFIIAKNAPDDYRVLLFQPAVDGISMQEALNQGVDPGPIINYLDKGLGMYGCTGVIPDLACFEKMFNPLVDPNTLVMIAGEDVEPILVDTTYGNLQRSDRFGHFVDLGIVLGVNRAINNLT